MNIRPLQDYILVKPLGRVMSDTLTVISRELSQRGEVIATGPGKRVSGVVSPIQVKVGDIVAYGEITHRYAVKQYDGNDKHLLMQDKDVECIFDECSYSESIK